MSVTLQPPPAADPAPESGPPADALTTTGRFEPRKVALWVVGLWLLSGLYIVGADEQAVTTIFGAVSNERVTPGVHYNLPWPVGSVYKLKVRQLQRTVVGGEIADTAHGRGR